MVDLVSSGGIVLRENHLLFIFKNGKWDLPKGKIEKSASAEKTALREISEETGLSKKKIKVVEPLIPTYHYTRYNGTRKLKKTEWFLCEYDGSLKDPLVPEKSEGIVYAQWIPLWKLERVFSNTHPRIAYLLDFFKEAKRL